MSSSAAEQTSSAGSTEAALTSSEADPSWLSKLFASGSPSGGGAQAYFPPDNVRSQEAGKVAELEIASAQQHKRTPVDVYRKPRATLPNGQAVEGKQSGTVYHGTDQIAPEEAFAKGLPARGDKLDLLEHAEQRGNSAFRGTNDWIFSPDGEGNGPGAWAGDGGWVYEIDNVSSWDVNGLLKGKVPMPDGTFGSNLMQAEAEKSILGGVARSRIKGAYEIVKNRSDPKRLQVGKFISNPNYEATQ